MKLSEAIRLGSMLAPQSHDEFIDSYGRTCARGAACQAAGIPIVAVRKIGVITYEWDFEDEEGLEEQAFPILTRIVSVPKELREEGLSCTSSVWGIVVALNDDLRWTRGQIADWVEGVEGRDCRLEEGQEKAHQCLESTEAVCA